MAVNLYVEIVEEKDVKNQLSLILDRIPRWRREKVLSYRNDIDRYLCAKSFMLLQEGLMRDYGVADEIRFSFNRYGKPFLADHPEIHFNLSHCRKGVACAIADSQVGIDIEEILYDDAVARYILSEEEYWEVTTSNNKAESFTKKWTEKESYLKMLGCGLLDNMKELDTGRVLFSTRIEREAGVVVTLCSRE
jgi:4'-phosphopantetheinyl transferase